MGLFHSKIAHWVFRVKTIFLRPKTAEIAHLIVEVEQGKLRGKTSVAANSRKKYCSFLGVPFAKPPVNDLRFRPPQPPEPWKGVYDASYERGECIQKDPFMYVEIGDEDCLYMNVYTPESPLTIQQPLPVMVFIHGGGFIFGSGSRKLYGADWLIPHNIILVAINYRLHVLGFLNLGIEECPGNVGLKDQIFALQYVQRNIRNFGGDPNNVTIFGESAGGCSVHYLMITPLAQGLFHKAILQSGFIQISGIITRNPIEIAFSVARKAGFRGTDRHKLIEYLKKFSAGDLVRLADEVLADCTEDTPARIAMFSPSVEAIAEGAFLPEDPFKMVKYMKPIPTIWGHNDLEGLVMFKMLPSNILDRINKDFTIMIKNWFRIDSEILPIVSEEVRELYFGEKAVASNTGREMADILTDLMFYRIHEAVDPLTKSPCPPYLYYFTYQGRLNFVKNYIKLTHADLALLNNMKGACHGDELSYMFYLKLLLLYPPISKKDLKIIHTITTLWTNFAKTGNPSTEDIEWKPALHKELCYLEIGENIRMINGKLGGERREKLHQLLDPVSEPI